MELPCHMEHIRHCTFHLPPFRGAEGPTSRSLDTAAGPVHTPPMNSPIGKPAFLAALGVLGTFLAWAFFHVPLVMRSWGPAAPATDPVMFV